MGIMLGGVEIYEWPWTTDEEGKTVVVDRSIPTSGGEVEAEELLTVAEVIYGPGLGFTTGVGEEVVPGGTDWDKVSEQSRGIVSVGRKEVVPGIVMPDELWLPGEAGFIANYRAAGFDGEVSQRELDGGLGGRVFRLTEGSLMSAALAGLLPLILSLVVAWVMDLLEDWIVESGGVEEAPKRAIYMRGRLIGYASGDVRAGPSGGSRLIGRRL